MKEFIGISVDFVVGGIAFKGTVVGDTPSYVMVKGQDASGITRILKSKIDLFCPSREPVAQVNLQVLFCENPGIGCPGVQLVCEGDGTSRSQMNIMNGSCPSKSPNCKCGTKGDVRCVDIVFLKKMLDGMLFGEFPAKKGVKIDG